MLRSAWLQLLQQQPSPTWLLAAVADAAYAKTPALQTNAVAVMRWLLTNLAEARLAQHSSIPAGLLTIPHIPLGIAEELCKQGVVVPYKAIVAAARQRVAGEPVRAIMPSLSVRCASAWHECGVAECAGELGFTCTMQPAHCLQDT
jgi:hypothetical protein